MNREDYEKQLQERQRQHLEKVRQNRDKDFTLCAHNDCKACHGTFVKVDGSRCEHRLVFCNCGKCSTSYKSPYKRPPFFGDGFYNSKLTVSRPASAGDTLDSEEDVFEQAFEQADKIIKKAMDNLGLGSKCKKGNCGCSRESRTSEE